jgi:hypothetical protein
MRTRLGHRARSHSRGEVARWHMTLQIRERWICELFVGRRRSS